MDEFLKLLAQYPLVLITTGILLGIIVLSVIIIFIMAFFQGREISFWPPKIGSRLSKQDKTQEVSEIKSDNLNDSDSISAELYNTPRSFPPINQLDVVIDSLALRDINILGISTEQIVNFILVEATRHPALFVHPFSSIPLVFENNTIFLSWNGSQATVEHVLYRSEAYPASNSWFLCVSLYRQATALPYRNKKTKAILSDAESHHIINLYRKLFRNISNFIELKKEKINGLSGNISAFESLLDEAEVSFVNGNHDIGIVRLEALLSSVHKLLLLYAPEAKGKNTNKSDSAKSRTPKLSEKGAKSILWVDDELIQLEAISRIIEAEGYRIAKAENGADALKAMVENDFDLVITDMVMPFVDGREVAIGARTISPKTKIILFSGYLDLSKKDAIPHDKLISKAESKAVFLRIIKNLLD